MQLEWALLFVGSVGWGSASSPRGEGARRGPPAVYSEALAGFQSASWLPIRVVSGPRICATARASEPAPPSHAAAA